VLGQERLHTGQHQVAGQELIDVAPALETNLSCILHLSSRLGHEMPAVLEIADEKK
jgi:hypothetical protein